MGLFSKNTNRNGAAGATTTTYPEDTHGHGNGTTRTGRGGMFHKEKTSHNHHHNNPDHLNRRPSFGQWLKATWVDLLTMVAMGLVGLGVYEAHPAPTRSFPINFVDGEIVYPQFAYPLRKEIVPIWLAALLGSLIPIFIILLMQIRVRSFWDVNNAVIGLLYSLITAAVFQVFLKWLIGGLRPHFLAVCKPVIPPGTVGKGYQSIMFTDAICTGDRNQIDDSLESFPSGHSTAAFAGFVFLYLYLNAKLKVWSNYHPAMWKLLAVYAPILGATLIAGALTIDEFHNWYDCLAGAIIGTVMAFSSYRMVYASVWDFRVNHIPLTRYMPFTYGAAGPGAGGFETAVFTRKAGWGHEEGAMGGAPFDMSGGMGSLGSGAAMGGAYAAEGATSGHHHHGNGPLGSNGISGHHDNATPRTPVQRRPVGDGMV